MGDVVSSANLDQMLSLRGVAILLKDKDGKIKAIGNAGMANVSFILQDCVAM